MRLTTKNIMILLAFIIMSPFVIYYLTMPFVRKYNTKNCWNDSLHFVGDYSFDIKSIIINGDTIYNKGGEVILLFGNIDKPADTRIYKIDE